MILENFTKLIAPYTMTSKERMQYLFESLEYIRKSNVEGDLVECGVWRGGNVLGMAQYLFEYNVTNKTVFAYDTFEGMTEPNHYDVDYAGSLASNILHLNHIRCEASLEEVNNNLKLTNFPRSQIRCIKGDVCQTLKNASNLPAKIALLRLDTDWYESTKLELEVLFPLLQPNGILIVDDYGHWKGSQKAFDEYFKNQLLKIHKVDYTGIAIVKNENYLK